MIKRVRIQNFKSLQDVDVHLSPFTVLIGQNGAGKSSFLQALQVLSWLFQYASVNDALVENDLTYNELVHLRAASKTIGWDVDITVPGIGEAGKDVRAVLKLAKRKHVHVSSEGIGPKRFFQHLDPIRTPFGAVREGRRMAAWEGTDVIIHENVTLPHSILLDARRQPDRYPALTAIADELAGFVHYEIWGPDFLRRSSEGGAGHLSERGENLPSVLHSLRTKHLDRFTALVSELQQSYEWLDSIEIRKIGARGFGLSFLEKATDKRRRRVRYAPSQVSDGFLRLLALTTLKYQREQVSAVGYEEPENGMHPAMLEESVKRLRDVAAQGTQVIVTTHSPFMLQHLLAEREQQKVADELRLVWRGADGKTIIRPPSVKLLSDAREQGIGVGELWAMLLAEQQMADQGE